MPGIDAEDEDNDDADEGLPPLKIALAVDSGAGGGIAEGTTARRATFRSDASRSGLAPPQDVRGHLSSYPVSGKAGTKSGLGASAMPWGSTEGSEFAATSGGGFPPSFARVWGLSFSCLCPLASTLPSLLRC